MPSIIEQIFYQTLENEQSFRYAVPSEQELSAYEAFRAQLTKAQKKSFAILEKLYIERQMNSEKELYFHAFRMGAQAALEITNADFTVKFP